MSEQVQRSCNMTNCNGRCGICTPAPAAPPEGEDVYADTDGQRMVHAEQRIAELTAALAAATARAERESRRADAATDYVLMAAKRLKVSETTLAGENIGERVLCAIDAAQAEAERLRGQNNDLMAKLGRMCGDA